MLLAGGMSDPTSIAVALGSAAAFLLLVAGGALRGEAGAFRLREWLLDRPFYLLGAVAVFVAVGAVFGGAAKLGLVLFSALHLMALANVAYALRRYLAAQGLGVFQSRADQLFILLGCTGGAAFLVFLDAVGSGSGAGSAGTPAMLVAILNILNLLYPPLLLVAARPFRAPLRLRLARRRPTVPAVVSDDAVPA